MESLSGQFGFQELIVILVIVFFLFGARKLPNLGENLGRAMLRHRGQWSDLRSALLMAKGVDPTVGRDVGDMIPDEDAKRAKPWFVGIIAILIGNTLYILSWPLLPTAARFGQASSSALPWLVDLYFCL